MATVAALKQEPVRTEPKVRRNGRCYVCGGERPLIAKRNNDPFCSSACCKQHYRVKAA